MTSTKTKEGEGTGGAKVGPILLKVAHGFWGRELQFN